MILIEISTFQQIVPLRRPLVAASHPELIIARKR
jgi:hypothetical protein